MDVQISDTSMTASADGIHSAIPARLVCTPAAGTSMEDAMIEPTPAGHLVIGDELADRDGCLVTVAKVERCTCKYGGHLDVTLRPMSSPAFTVTLAPEQTMRRLKVTR